MGSRLQKEGDNAFSRVVGCATRGDRLTAAARSISGTGIGLVGKNVLEGSVK
jgi:hypothetical protein